MRNMSFALTSEKIRNKTKTVTRRLGWKFLKFGDLVQPVEKSMGIKKGEKIKKIGDPIRIVSVDRRPLKWIDVDDVMREGYFYTAPLDFIRMFCNHMKCRPLDMITRIEFEYVEAAR